MLVGELLFIYVLDNYGIGTTCVPRKAMTNFIGDLECTQWEGSLLNIIYFIPKLLMIRFLDHLVKEHKFLSLVLTCVDSELLFCAHIFLLFFSI